MSENEALNKSALQSYISQFDMANIDWGYSEYWKHALAQDFRIWNGYFLNEIKFRAKFGLNVVWSVEGGQGSGKSMCLLRQKRIIDDAYGVEYDLEKFVSQIHFFTSDLEEALSMSERRTTNVLDEQIKSHGIMTRFTEDMLANYEDTFRKPQKNIGFASPSLRRHEHFFVFEALGDIFVDNEGNTSAVEVMLKTKRKSDGLLMPRGVLRLKAPEKDLWEMYNLKKDAFIEKMEKKEGGVMGKIERDADRVIAEFGDFLYKDKNGLKVPAGSKTIDLYMYKCVGMRSYTMNGYDLLREEIKRKL